MKNKYTIYLSGGGNWDKTIEIDSIFLKDLANKEILFIPTAKEADEEGYKDCYEWLVNKLKRIDSGIKVDVELDFNKIKKLDNYSAVYIGGGNTYKLLNLLNQSNFRNFLNGYLERDGVIFGASAGAVILGKDISTYMEENEKYNYSEDEGLNLVGGYSIMCHHIENENTKANEYINRTSNPVIAIPVGVAIKISGGCFEVIGDGPVSVFEVDGTESKITGKVSLSDLKKVL